VVTLHSGYEQFSVSRPAALFDKRFASAAALQLKSNVADAVDGHTPSVHVWASSPGGSGTRFGTEEPSPHPRDLIAVTPIRSNTPSIVMLPTIRLVI
jgi:hypothetical protein